MVLSNGQTYFYILCQWFVIGYVVKVTSELIRMYLVNKAPCRGLRDLENEVKTVRRLALVAYQRTLAKKPEDKKNA